MFLLPRALRSGDSIGVSGIMTSDKQRFTVNLIAGYNATDYENTACQLEVNFTQDRVTLRIIHNGVSEQIQGDYESLPASAWFTSANFNFTFKASIEGYDGGHLLDIFIGESFLEQITLRHNIEDIRFLTLQGDIEKVMELDFKFS